MARDPRVLALLKDLLGQVRVGVRVRVMREDRGACQHRGLHGMNEERDVMMDAGCFLCV